MTDRWETENSDGWQSMDCSAIRFLHLRGGIHPSKKTAILYLPQTGRLADLPAIRQAHMQAIQPSRPQV